MGSRARRERDKKKTTKKSRWGQAPGLLRSWWVSDTSDPWCSSAVDDSTPLPGTCTNTPVFHGARNRSHAPVLAGESTRTPVTKASFVSPPPVSGKCTCTHRRRASESPTPVSGKRTATHGRRASESPTPVSRKCAHRASESPTPVSEKCTATDGRTAIYSTTRELRTRHASLTWMGDSHRTLSTECVSDDSKFPSGLLNLPKVQFPSSHSV